MKRRAGSPFRFVELANDINSHMPEYVVERLILGLNREGKSVKGSRILLLGLAYKADTADVRESPAVAVAERLVALEARVRIADPHVDEVLLGDRVTRVELKVEELTEADAVVILTPHHAFDLDLVARHAGYVLDTRRCMVGAQVESL